MAFKIVFTPHPVLAYDKRKKERFVTYVETKTRSDADKTLEYLQKNGLTEGIYKIVPADYQLKDV